MPMLLAKVLDLSSWKIEIIFQIGLPNPKEIDFFSGGKGFWILTFDGRVPKKHPKKVSWEK